MKKLLSIGLCIVLIISLALPVSAGGMEVQFTEDSSFQVGGTISVDKAATMEYVSVYGTSDYYNAYLEGNVQYYWFKDNEWFHEGTSLTVTESLAGKTIFCRAYLFSDMDRTQSIGSIDSASYTVYSNQPPFILTGELEVGYLNQPYYQQLECDEADASFSIVGGALPDGMNLTQHGELEGTPTQTGTFYVTIAVTDEYGAQDSTQFQLEINEFQPLVSYHTVTLDPELATGEVVVHRLSPGILALQRNTALGRFTPVIVLLLIALAVLLLALLIIVLIIVIVAVLKRKKKNKVDFE